MVRAQALKTCALMLSQQSAARSYIQAALRGLALWQQRPSAPSPLEDVPSNRTDMDAAWTLHAIVRGAAKATATSGLIDVEDLDAALVHVVQVRAVQWITQVHTLVTHPS